jgi:hypothetical protein
MRIQIQPFLVNTNPDTLRKSMWIQADPDPGEILFIEDKLKVHCSIAADIVTKA